MSGQQLEHEVTKEMLCCSKFYILQYIWSRLQESDCFM